MSRVKEKSKKIKKKYVSKISREPDCKTIEEYNSDIKTKNTNPKYAMIEQEVEMMEQMTEGQLAEYLAEHFNDY